MPQQAAVVSDKSDTGGVDVSSVWTVSQIDNVVYKGQGEYAYVGRGENDEEDIGTVRMLSPLSLSKGGMSTFDVTLLDTGEQNYIAIGVCDSDYPSNLLPGWEKTSVAFHMDEGSIFNSSEDPELSTSACKPGDTIKCSLLPCPTIPGKISVEFQRNGEKVLDIVTDSPPTGLYGIIGMMSKGERIRISLPVVMARMEFDQVWEVSCPEVVSHIGNGVCSYIGRGDFREDSIGTVRSKVCIDPLGPLHARSFEIKIVDPGEKGYIGIGVCGKYYPANKLPGWEDVSVGYHADNGHLFNSSAEGHPTDHPCKRGDMMRCTVETIDGSPKQVKVSFFKNGQLVGSRTPWNPENGFYMCFGMMSRRERVQVLLPEISQTYSPPKKQFHDVWVFPNANFLYKENGICAYVGSGGNQDIATVRTRRPLDPFSSGNSFEVKIIDPGRKCYIALGVCIGSYPPNLPPGWKDLSVGFNAESGLILQSSGGEMQTSHPCSCGDVLRCTVEPVDGATKEMYVSFYRNGSFVGRAHVWPPADGLYGLVSCISIGEVVQIACPGMEPSSLQPSQTPSPMSGFVPHQLPAQYNPSRVASSALPPGYSDRGNPPVSGSAFIPEPGMGTGFEDFNGGMMQRMHVSHSEGEFSSMERRAQAREGLKQKAASQGQQALEEAMRQMRFEHQQREAYSRMPSGFMPSGPHAHARTPHPGYYPFPHPPHPDFPIHPRFRHHHPWAHYHPYHYHHAQHLSMMQPLGSSSPTPSHQQYPHMSLSMNPNSGSNFPQTVNPHHPLPPSSSSSSLSSLPAHMHPSHQPPASLPLSFKKGLLDTPPSSKNPDPVFASQVSTASSASDSDAPFDPNEAAVGPPVFKGKGGGSTLPSINKPHLSPLSEHLSLESTSSASTPKADEEAGSQWSGETGTGSTLASPSYPRAPSLRMGAQSKGAGKVKFQGYDFPDNTPKESTGSEGMFVREPLSHTIQYSAAAQSDPKMGAGGGNVPSGKPEHHPRPKSVPPRVIPKEENKMYQILDNVATNDDGSLSCLLLPQSSTVSLTKCRLPLSEKMPYFEVSLCFISPGGNVAIGLTSKQYPSSSPPHILGCGHDTVAYHSISGALHVSSVNGKTLSPQCVSEDVIGCKLHLKYKSEITDPEIEDKDKVQLEFFRNGLSIGVEMVQLPPEGFYPTVAFSGHGTRIKLQYNITVSPDQYFDNHPIPADYENFPRLSPLSQIWNCINNSEMQEGRFLTIRDPAWIQPAVVQSSLPFTEMTPYFELELLCPIATYSVLSMGALPKTKTGVQNVIPGEAPGSVGFLPLLGFVMRNGVISSSIPDTITYSERTTIGVGVNFNSSTVSSALSPCIGQSKSRALSSFSSSSSSFSTSPSSSPMLPRSGSTSSSLSFSTVSIFFTVNGQQVSSTVAPLPPGGFFPTLALDSDARDRRGQRMVALNFSKILPCVKGFPYGFVRGSVGEFTVLGSMAMVDNKLTNPKAKKAVRILQAAFPLSPSRTYFEIRILEGGENFCISCGLASHNYPIDAHPGWAKDSIAFHADDGNLFHNSKHHSVAPPCPYRGVIIGCGARFPLDGSSNFAEVFFTVNKVIVAKKLTAVPNVGFFPTIGVRARGALIVTDLHVADPFPDMQFCSTWSVLDNIRVEGGSCIQVQNLSKPGLAQLASTVSPDELFYFQVSPLPSVSGSVSIGFASPGLSPFGPLTVYTEGMKCYVAEINTGGVFLKDQFRDVKENSPIEGGSQVGCGLQPLPSSDQSLLFFTVDSQVVYCTSVNIQDCLEALHPVIHIMGSKVKLTIDACALWPPMCPIGRGWARYSNLMLRESMITHTLSSSKTKVPLGFAQAAMPVTPSTPYFEVEVCSRAPTNRIAVGLASKEYRGTIIVGCKQRSIAFNLCDGKLYKGHTSLGQDLDLKINAGHMVGCGIRFTSHQHISAVSFTKGTLMEVFFTVNGAIIATDKVPITPGGLYPTICLDGPTESVIFHQRHEFPPVSNCVDQNWSNAYSIYQSGIVLKHSFKHHERAHSRAFCQAKEPLSPKRPYFEIEIVGFSEVSQIAGGVAPTIPKGSSTFHFDSILYHCSGHLQMKRGTQKETHGSQKCCLGDKLGCAIIFNDSYQPVAIEFYLNNLKMVSKEITSDWRETQLYPTIILSHPNDAVIPKLHLPLPEWDKNSLVGWLRSERVKLRNNVVEYAGSGASSRDVGVAQVNRPLQLEVTPYFEIEVLNRGERGTMSIGAAPADYALNMQPGWKEESVGYHGDDGCLFHNNGSGSAFGPTWRLRDVIGMGIRTPTLPEGSSAPPTEVQAFFTRNGEEIGHTTVNTPHSGFFPTIGLHSPQETVKISFHSSIPSNSDHINAAWRTLSGMKVSKSHSEDENHTYILRYWENGRRMIQIGVRLSIAIFAQQFSESMQYFEVEILSFGNMNAIAIGVVPKQYSLEQCPGWEAGSVAYHTDNGELYYSSGRGKVFGPVGRKRDVIGCGVSFIPNDPKHCSVFFTYNGVEIGRARTAIPSGGLFPAVGFISKGDKVKVRFMDTFKPRIAQSEFQFVGLMRIHNCSYSDQIVRFTGGGSSGVSSAPAMAQFAVSLHHGRNYFKASFICNNDSILIGLAVRDYPMKYVPGFTSVSIAYDTSKGTIRAVYSSENFVTLDDLPKCEVGDCLGCGIEVKQSDPKSEQAFVFFTLNDNLIKRIELVDVYEDLYPIIGIIPKNRSSAIFMDWSTPVFDPLNVL